MANQFISPVGDIEQYFLTEYWMIDQFVGDGLWTWGFNGYGQLGTGNLTQQCTPVTTQLGGTTWKQVSCGYEHTAAVKSDGTLWTWGRNQSGQLGNNGFGTGKVVTPTTTWNGGTTWKQVSCGGNNTSAIKTDGTLWNWGSNSYGQLGINSISTNRCSPVQTYLGGNDWNQVSSNFRFTAAVKNDGSLWTWGFNGYGQLGNGTQTSVCTPISVGGNDWKQVACGLDHIAAIKNDGTLWTWGRNDYGQLGVNDTATRLTPVTVPSSTNTWKQVSCGYYHTVAIKIDGTLWVWGRGSSGQLGTNNLTTVCTPVQTYIGGSNWKQVSCGQATTAAVKVDGSAWLWGQNTFGNLGGGFTGSVCTPVTTFFGATNWKQISAGTFHSAAVTSGTNPIMFNS
jgi:alpha-tubulin suppressor-like RCC1 family protein